VLLPLSWVLLASFKHPTEIFTYPPTIFPHRFTLQNYVEVLSRTEMVRYLINTFVVAVLSTLLTLGLSAPAAYGFSYHQFKLKYALLVAMLGIQLIPGSVNIIPYYIMMSKMGLLNTLVGLILIYASIRAPFSIWILKAHFDSLPSSLADAARVDGCSGGRILWSIILPLSLPGLGAAGFLSLLFSWGQFLLPLVIASSRQTMVVGVGLYSFFGVEGNVYYHHLFAASMLTIAPLLIAYLVAQETFVAGLTRGAVK
jgi:ABC-type glycerol-3-phosphate transport system permease component